MTKKTNKKLNILIFNFNEILTDVIQELGDRGHNILPLDGKESTAKKADVIVLWNETDLGGWKNWIKEYRKMRKKVILIQHGRRGTSRIYPPFNEKLESEVICAWGKNDVSRLTSCGVPKERIRVTGTTIFKHLKPRVPHEGINVVFSPEHWGGGEVQENIIVMNELKKLKGVNVISKLLQGEHYPELYLNPVISHRGSREHLPICAEVLKTADVVVAISESTFELLAESLDIPVVIADIWQPKACDGDDRYKEYFREYSNACTRVKNIKQLNDAIKWQIKHPELLREERRQIVIDDGGTDIENPLEELIKIIENGN